MIHIFAGMRAGENFRSLTRSYESRIADDYLAPVKIMYAVRRAVMFEAYKPHLTGHIA